MEVNMPDWIVRIYDEDGEMINSWEILDRTQIEAEEEVLAELDLRDLSWSLISRPKDA
jgi:hypothetical protein